MKSHFVDRDALIKGINIAHLSISVAKESVSKNKDHNFQLKKNLKFVQVVKMALVQILC